MTLVFAAQVALIFVLGEKKFPPSRAVKNVPQLTLADGSSELIALDDPTLFALPHANDYRAAVPAQMPVAPQLSLESPKPPPLPVENLGAVFTRFMQTNQFGSPAPEFKPEPELSEPVAQLQPLFAGNSTLRVEGELAQRKWLNPVSLADWPYADVIAPSKVQVLVNAAGDVVSTVLLPPDDPSEAASHDNDADQYALALARNLRFAPAPGLTAGRLMFDWRTVAPPATNSPTAAP